MKRRTWHKQLTLHVDHVHSFPPSIRLVNKWLPGAFKGRLSAVKCCAFILRSLSDTSQGVYRRCLTCKVNVKRCCRQNVSPSNGGIVFVLWVLFCCFAGSKTFTPSFLHFYSFPPCDGRRRQLSFGSMLSCPPLPPSSPLLPPSPPPPTHTKNPEHAGNRAPHSSAHSTTVCRPDPPQRLPLCLLQEPHPHPPLEV